MPTVINRRILTDHLLDRLQPTGEEDQVWVVGDHEKPPEGGWQGSAGRATWIPYMVLTATPSQRPTGSVGDSESDVWFGYAVTVVGTTRQQADNASFQARERLMSLKRVKTEDGRSISKVQTTRYGSVDRLPTDPPLYLITDQFTVFTTK